VIDSVEIKQEYKDIAKGIGLTFGPGKHTQLVWDISHALADMEAKTVENEQERICGIIRDTFDSNEPSQHARYVCALVTIREGV